MIEIISVKDLKIIHAGYDECCGCYLCSPLDFSAEIPNEWKKYYVMWQEIQWKMMPYHIDSQFS